MAYDSTVPSATQRIDQSQSIIQANFAALVSFGNGYAELSNQISAPTFSAGNDGLYTKNFTTTSTNEMYIHIQRPAAATAEIPFTASKMSNTAAASCDNGWSYIPSGLLIKWGSVNATTASVSVDVAATSGGPNFTQCFRAFVSPFDSGSAVNFTCGQRTTVNATTGNFTAYCQNYSASTTKIRYMVIGV